jgi:hypothetical protein
MPVGRLFENSLLNLAFAYFSETFAARRIYEVASVIGDEVPAVRAPQLWRATTFSAIMRLSSVRRSLNWAAIAS